MLVRWNAMRDLFSVFPFFPSINLSGFTLKDYQNPMGNLYDNIANRKGANLDIDLTDLFNWNTKQLYTYITVTYPGSNYVRSK